MTNTATIKSPADVAPIVSRVLGFVPADSFVVIGIGHQVPTARVDLNSLEDFDGIADGLAPALAYWRTGAVVVGIYTDDDALALATVLALESILPEVNVVMATQVKSDADHHRPTFSVLDAKHVADGRASVEAMAADVTDADLAEHIALESFEAGNGAMAWVFHDRANVLRDNVPSPAMLSLALALEGAIRPAGLTA